MGLSQKGFSPIYIIIILLFAGLGAVLIHKSNTDVRSQAVPQVSISPATPLSSSSLPVLDENDLPNLIIAKYIQPNGDYLPKDQDPNLGEIVIALPKNAQILSRTVDENAGVYQASAKIKIDQNIYELNTSANPAGLCPMVVDKSTSCGYTDEGEYRVWHDQTGKFAISLAGLTVDNYQSNIITIFKTSSNKDFSDQEIQQWEKIFNAAKVYKSDFK